MLCIEYPHALLDIVCSSSAFLLATHWFGYHCLYKPMCLQWPNGWKNHNNVFLDEFHFSLLHHDGWIHIWRYCGAKALGGMNFAASSRSGPKGYGIGCNCIPVLLVPCVLHVTLADHWYCDHTSVKTWLVTIPVTSQAVTLRCWSLRWYLIFRAFLVPYTK